MNKILILRNSLFVLYISPTPKFYILYIIPDKNSVEHQCVGVIEVSQLWIKLFCNIGPTGGPDMFSARWAGVVEEINAINGYQIGYPGLMDRSIVN